MTDWSEALIQQAMHEGDQLADETIQAVVADHGPQGAIDVLGKLIEHPHVPRGHPAIEHYLDRTNQPAVPLTAEQEKLSDTMFENHGWVFFGLLGCASLPEGYVVPDITRVLGATQQLEAHVHRRLWETVQFVLDVMQPGGMDEGGPGIKSIQKVRLLHAVIRYLIVQDPEDHQAAHGFAQTLLKREWTSLDEVPISQTYLAATILGFGFVPLRALGRLGYDCITVEEQEAYLARWNVVGELMGVRRDLVATTMADSQRMFEAIREPRKGPSDDGTKLGQALVSFMEAQVPKWLFPLRAMPRMLIVDVCDPGVPEMIGIRLNRLERMLTTPTLHMMKWWAHMRSTIIKGSPAAAAGVRYLFNKLSRNMLRKERGWSRGDFEIPPHLLSSWKKAPDA